MAKSAKATKAQTEKGNETSAAAHSKKSLTKESAQAIVDQYIGIDGVELPKEVQEARKFLNKGAKTNETETE
jgi:hypothetical protein